jgi:phage shock protein PspC (stress-responsive transcriptional regulator)
VPTGAPLRRLRQDRVIAGVLGGIAKHFDLDVGLLRVVYVFATIFTAFVGGIIYLMAWVVIPEEPGDSGAA